MTNMSRILLNDNFFNASIPESISSLSGLQFLYLQNNYLAGNLEDIDFSSMKTLRGIYLYNNLLTGSLPTSLSTSLMYLSLSRNKFHGILEQNNVGKLTNLVKLDLDSNKFTGGVLSLQSLMLLNELSLRDNQFTGTLPLSFSNLVNISLFDVSMNRFSGLLPNFQHFSMNNVNPARVVDLSDGNFSINSIPLFNVVNRLSGVLNVSFNSFSGTIPEEYGHLGVQSLDLSSNKLQGQLPTQFSNATSTKLLRMRQLFVNDNQLTGPIRAPDSLEVLDVSNNALSGDIPSNLFHIRSRMNVFSASINCLNLDSIYKVPSRLSSFFPLSLFFFSLRLLIILRILSMYFPLGLSG